MDIPVNFWCLISFFKTNQKKFLELVSSGAVSQVGKMAEKGIDPNFHDDRTGGKKLNYTWKSFVIVYMYPYLYHLFASYIYQ